MQRIGEGNNRLLGIPGESREGWAITKEDTEDFFFFLTWRNTWVLSSKRPHREQFFTYTCPCEISEFWRWGENLQASSKEKAGCLPRKKNQIYSGLSCNTMVLIWLVSWAGFWGRKTMTLEQYRQKLPFTHKDQRNVCSDRQDWKLTVSKHLFFLKKTT